MPNLSETLELMLENGESAIAIAKIFDDQEGTNITPMEAAQIIRTAGKDAQFATDVLKFGYGQSEEAVAATLKGAGYAADEVGKALKLVYGLGAEATAGVLKTAGWGIDATKGALDTVYDLGDEATGKALEAGGYAKDKIKDLVGDIWGGITGIFG